MNSNLMSDHRGEFTAWSFWMLYSSLLPSGGVYWGGGECITQPWRNTTTSWQNLTELLFGNEFHLLVFSVTLLRLCRSSSYHQRDVCRVLKMHYSHLCTGGAKTYLQKVKPIIVAWQQRSSWNFFKMVCLVKGSVHLQIKNCVSYSRLMSLETPVNPICT